MNGSHDLKTVPEYFYQTCEQFPSRPAQRYSADLYQGDNNGRFTYDEMRGRVECIACGLMSLGMARQDRVALMSRTTPYWTQVDLAVASAAGVVVTIYSTLSAGEALYILKDSGSRYLFVDTEENLGKILEHKDELPGLEKIVVMDFSFERKEGSGELVISLWELMSRGKGWRKEHLDLYRERVAGVKLDDWYTILYTSGTTGTGKGVILTHRCVSSRIEGVREFFSAHGMAITQDDVTLCYLPLSHIFERGSCELLAICQGASIAYADRPATLLQDMQRYNPTWINCVPRLYEKIYVSIQERVGKSPLRKKLFDLAVHAGRKALDYRRDHRGTYNMSPDYELEARLPLGLKIQFRLADRLFAQVRFLFGRRFRFAFSASAGISPDLLRFFYTLGLAVVEGYGSTETASACILNPITACKPGFVGIEACGSHARVAEDGELEVSGAGIFAGYLNLAGETAEAFTPDGWFKTGDIVKPDGYGYYRIVDRKKAIICTAVGKNIAPAKLENLFALSSVVEQVFFVGDERNYISALVVPNFGYFIDLFEKEGIPYDKGALRYSQIGGMSVCTQVGEDFVSQPRLKELIEHDVAEVNARLEDFEQVRRYTILTARFTEENGLLTPTQKTKKKAIIGNYRDIIEGMYTQGEGLRQAGQD
ncbi:MAG TPA: AMP-binding protein [Deltaproteobacteria bacterium]|jgi:long-chain acyl-CoA synthetase|nr:AMP-binding protein [Deltaproteobacteria bacterium]HOI07385.1 AMP-binding protein [Deltaproteobacteria bacterium]